MVRQRVLAASSVLIIAVGAVVACGCAQRSARADVPAVLTNPTPESRAELVRVVREAMNGAPVTMADEALTADGTLIVERAASREVKDMNLRGRDTGRPEHFRLVMSGSRCVLVHVETGRRWTLAAATCAPR